MAWDQQWQHRVDSLELNNLAAGLVCEVPEVSDLFAVENILVPIQGGYPVFHRAQPLSGQFTFLMHVLHPTDADFDTRINLVKAVMTQGVPHAYTFQVRGMPSALTIPEIYFESVGDFDYKTGKVTAVAVAPDPRAAT